MARTAVVAGTATAVVGGVQRRQQRRAEEQAQYQEVRAAAFDSQAQLDEMRTSQSSQAAPAAGGTDVVAELERLAKLRDSGVLSDSEFDAAKAKLLGT